MVYLTLDDILAIRDQVARECANPVALREPSSLYAAMEAPGSVLFGQEMFQTLAEKAGALLYGLVQHHPFWDGNKRIATRALELFLLNNGARVTVSAEALQAYAREIARGKLSRDDVVAWLNQRIEVHA